MLGAEVEHLLRLGDAADHGSGPAAARGDERERGDLERLGRGADVDERAVDREQADVLRHVELRGDRVDDQVERAGELGERGVVARREVAVGSEAEAVLLLGERLREHGDLGAHGVRDLHGHVAEAAHADDGDLRAGARVPVAERRVGGDAGAEQRRDLLDVEGLGDAEHEVLVDDDGLGVAALRDGAVGRVGAAVGLDVALQAVLLLTGRALLALLAGVDHAADADEVADLVLGDLGADLGDAADDLVADDLRVGDGAPLAADGVDVGVADARVGDVDGDVLRADVAALDGGLGDGIGGGRGRVGVDGAHGFSLC